MNCACTAQEDEFDGRDIHGSFFWMFEPDEGGLLFWCIRKSSGGSLWRVL